MLDVQMFVSSCTSRFLGSHLVDHRFSLKHCGAFSFIHRNNDRHHSCLMFLGWKHVAFSLFLSRIGDLGVYIWSFSSGPFQERRINREERIL